MEFDKNNCTLYYKSGDGESWIKPSFRDQNGKYLKLTEEQVEFLENEYNHIVRQHDHYDGTGYGHIVIKGGTVIEISYETD